LADVGALKDVEEELVRQSLGNLLNLPAQELVALLLVSAIGGWQAQLFVQFTHALRLSWLSASVAFLAKRSKNLINYAEVGEF
jgi:hypothetical protein